MQLFRYLLMFSMVTAALPIQRAAADEQSSYVVEEQGRGTIRSFFDRKMKSSAEQWEYARETQNRGQLKKAERRMLYLMRRWPNSKEAPWAARARADILLGKGKLVESFKAYQFLIDNYSSRMLDYDSVLDNQFDIASRIMDRRRMRWLFGGYRAPEYAVDYLESVIRNGPQWPGAPEAQMLIGMCYQETGELELAISAYEVLGYRYPDSTYAEEAAWEQALCLDLVRKKYPNNAEPLERLVTSTTIFLTTYPKSEHSAEIIQMRNSVYEVMAQHAFDEAVFYEEIPRKAEAAIIYFEKMIGEYPKSRLVQPARDHIAELRRLLALRDQQAEPLPLRSRPLPIGKGSDYAVE